MNLADDCMAKAKLIKDGTIIRVHEEYKASIRLLRLELIKAEAMEAAIYLERERRYIISQGACADG